jgi:hypothetical protein
LKKLSEDLSKRVGELKNTSRLKDDDTDRTSRVRIIEKELNDVLNENSVS